VSKRLYPFQEPSQKVTTSSTTQTLDVTWTVHKPNPFTGWRKWAFAFDEFNHRHGLNHRGPLRWFCTWWDRRLG
jgi:hypothetical protein